MDYCLDVVIRSNENVAMDLHRCHPAAVDYAELAWKIHQDAVLWTVGHEHFCVGRLDYLDRCAAALVHVVQESLIEMMNPLMRWTMQLRKHRAGLASGYALSVLPRYDPEVLQSDELRSLQQVPLVAHRLVNDVLMDVGFVGRCVNHHAEMILLQLASTVGKHSLAYEPQELLLLMRPT
jgi:hypothetical protein